MSFRNLLNSSVQYAVCVLMLATIVRSQEMSNLERGEAIDMLQVVANDLRKHYYDPKFHGIDWEASIGKARQQIDKAPSMNMAISYIAAAVDSLNDSHTTFYPPERMHRYYYVWHYQMIGDRCYLTRIRPNSDAAAKGVKPGDEILTVNGFLPDRNNLWKMNYVLQTLRPQPSMKLLLQTPPEGKSREVEVAAAVTMKKRPTDLSYVPMREWEQEAREMRARYLELGDELMILKFPYFEFSNAEIAGIMGRASKHKTLILDLRGNPGGSTETLKYVVGALFDKDIKIADRVTRKDTKPMEAKPQRNVFGGKLIVLVDSESASASELLARVVQLEKRGVVLGDRSSGSVMEARYYSNHLGGNLAVFYGEMISDADLMMSDGKSLEHAGVVPDELILPTGADLAAGRDPVLARAAELAGVKLNPEAAGTFFPYEWPQVE